jgi:hypothetical protein
MQGAELVRARGAAPLGTDGKEMLSPLSGDAVTLKKPWCKTDNKL